MRFVASIVHRVGESMPKAARELIKRGALPLLFQSLHLLAVDALAAGEICHTLFMLLEAVLKDRRAAEASAAIGNGAAPSKQWEPQPVGRVQSLVHVLHLHPGDDSNVINAIGCLSALAHNASDLQTLREQNVASVIAEVLHVDAARVEIVAFASKFLQQLAGVSGVDVKAAGLQPAAPIVLLPASCGSALAEALAANTGIAQLGLLNSAFHLIDSQLKNAEFCVAFCSAGGARVLVRATGSTARPAGSAVPASAIASASSELLYDAMLQTPGTSRAFVQAGAAVACIGELRKSRAAGGAVDIPVASIAT